MKEAKVCPCCGTDIVLDEPILINDFSMMGAQYPLLHHGERISLTKGQATICWSLMKAYPSHMTDVALMERLGSESENPDNLIKVYVSRIRRILRECGAPQAIRTLYGHHAYVWDPLAQ